MFAAARVYIMIRCSVIIVQSENSGFETKNNNASAVATLWRLNKCLLRVVSCVL